jgi:hypothetical protein
MSNEARRAANPRGIPAHPATVATKATASYPRHPATVAQTKGGNTAAGARDVGQRPQHPATVAQPKPASKAFMSREPRAVTNTLPTAAARPAHAATVAQPRRAHDAPPVRSPHPAVVVQPRVTPQALPARPPHAAKISRQLARHGSDGSNSAAAATAQPAVLWSGLKKTGATLGTGLWNTTAAAVPGAFKTLVAGTAGTLNTAIEAAKLVGNTSTALGTGLVNTYNAGGAWNKTAALGTGAWNTGAALGTGLLNTGTALGTGVWNTGKELALGSWNTGAELLKTVGNTGAALGTGLANAAAYQVPAGPEWLKEYIDPRRASLNPYWRRTNQLAVNYEAAHAAVGYHSVAKHGGQHTLTNIRARLIPHAGPGNPSYMVDPGGALVRRAGTSSRFANDAWHNYTRAMTIARFEALIAPTGGAAAWTWPNALVPPSAWNLHHTFINYPNTLSFDMTYEGNIVGFSVDGAHQYGEPCDSTHSLVGYDNAGNAYLNQHYPVVGTTPAQHQLGGAPAVAFAAGNTTIAYDDVPWL